MYMHMELMCNVSQLVSIKEYFNIIGNFLGGLDTIMLLPELYAVSGVHINVHTSATHSSEL